MSNIREIGVSINRYKNILVEEKAVKEEIANVNHNKVDNQITIQTRFFNSLNELIKEDTTFVEGEYYDLLMSNSEVFEKNKTLDSFRDSDLWYVVDQIRDKQTS